MLKAYKLDRPFYLKTSLLPNSQQLNSKIRRFTQIATKKLCQNEEAEDKTKNRIFFQKKPNMQNYSPVIWLFFCPEGRYSEFIKLKISHHQFWMGEKKSVQRIRNFQLELHHVYSDTICIVMYCIDQRQHFSSKTRELFNTGTSVDYISKTVIS